MNSHLAPRISSFFVAKLHNSSLLRALCASNLNILSHNLLRSDLIRGSLTIRLAVLRLPLLSLLLLASCATLQPGYETPTVTVNSFRTLPGEGVAPRFEIGLRILNPNRSPLKLHGIAYSVHLEGHRLLAGVANDLPEVAPYGEANITLVAGVDLLGGIGLIGDLLQASRKSLSYRLEAKLDIGPLQPAIRINHEGQISLGPHN
jgi:LEA14-like dessication related protein